MKTKNSYVVPQTTCQALSAMQIMSVSYGFDNNPGDEIIGG